MNRTTRTALLIGTVLALTMAGIAASATSAVHFQKIPDYDLGQLGFAFEPPGLFAAAPGLAQSDAESVAARVLEVSGTPETQRLNARVLPDEPKRSVWVVVFDGGSSADVPWGPYSETTRPLHSPTYSGALVDDRTGEVLVTFRGGSQ